ncbi:MAG: hypothetical protein ABJI65_11750, partial [Tateyamaria sp.]|uniref:hypothetical protein n=1 Tax=Tateyamaria sp. TaxID=1929288 RepID=UPI00329E62FA
VFQGHSLLFQNRDLVGQAFDETHLASLPTRSPQFGFPLWGGEKTWIAPDKLWTDGAPFPSLDSGPYLVISNDVTHVELTSPVCSLSQLSVSRRISLMSATSWNITHTVTNHGPSPRETGIWSVMMIDTPAKIGVAMDTPQVHPVFGNAGSPIAKNANCVVADCARQQEFKVGLPNPNGATLIKFGNTGPWLICTTHPPLPQDNFAHQFPVEVFNSGDYPYCEAEWHSPKSDLRPGEALKFQQDFRIWPNDAPPAPDAPKELFSCMS